MAVTLEQRWERYQRARHAWESEREQLRAHVVAEVEAGTSEYEIARRLDTSRTTVRGLLGKRKRYPSPG